MICFWTLQGCLQVVMEVVELGISGSKSREIPRVSNTTNQCGFTCALNFWGKKSRRRGADGTGLPPFDTDFSVGSQTMPTYVDHSFHQFWHSNPINFSTKVSVMAIWTPQLFFFHSLQFPFHIVNFLKIKTVLTNIFLLLSQGSSARNRIYPSVKRWVNTKVPLLLLAVSAQFCVCSRIDISKGHRINHV